MTTETLPAAEISTNSAASVEWDLSDLFASPDDPNIEMTLISVEERARKFQETYQGAIAVPDLSAATLLAAIREYEALSQDAAKPGTYANLRFAADTSDSSRGAFLQRMRERRTKISLLTLFFELELAQISDDVHHAILSDPNIAGYSHYIETVRLYKDHMLSETEECLLEETANTGARAFSRLFEQITSATVYHLGGEELSQSQIMAKLYSPDRETRRAAAAALSQGLQPAAPTVVFIYNTLLQDKNVKDRLRQYTYPEQSRHLANELTPEIVETVVQTCTAHYDLVRQYYQIKKSILGVDQLMHYDRYAPIVESNGKVLWSEARSLVLDAFQDFSPLMRAKASEFFDRGWIDAAPRKGKRGGAFCSYVTPDLHPYILQSFMEQSRDVMTLAHELGHGVHSSLSRDLSYFNFHGTLPLAELASTFGEMLVFERLKAQTSPQERLALYAGKIEDAFSTIFRQASMYRFEQAIHRHRRERGELTQADFAGYWQDSLQAMFGDSLTLGDEHKLWWSYVGHFVGSPFYVYAYSFGELLVLSLFQKYKAEGPAFAEKYLDLLRAGGSFPPQKLMDKVGVDLSDPAFWQGGMQVLKAEIEEFQELWSDVGSLARD